MRIVLACDHGAFELKNELVTYLKDKENIDVIDLGVNGPDSVDYPEYAGKLCRTVLDGEAQRGILLCGTGIGISIAANRFKGIRAALCHDVSTAHLAREHNDANVLVMGGRTTGLATARDMVDVWLKTQYAGGRHQRRLDKIEELGE